MRNLPALNGRQAESRLPRNRQAPCEARARAQLDRAATWRALAPMPKPPAAGSA
jgi:hypothetical protein